MTEGPQEAQAQVPVPQRVSFGKRLGAYLVDWVILVVISVIVGAVLPGALAQLVSLLLGLGYFTYLEGSPSGQTVGKRALSIRVVDSRTGGPLDYGKAAIRYVGKIISGIPIFLGFFWMLWDPQKETWHDKIATTTVVSAADFPVDRWPG